MPLQIVSGQTAESLGSNDLHNLSIEASHLEVGHFLYPRPSSRYWRNPSLELEHAGRVVAKVEGHPGELYPRVGLIVTNLARPADQVVAFYNQRGHYPMLKNSRVRQTNERSVRGLIYYAINN